MLEEKRLAEQERRRNELRLEERRNQDLRNEETRRSEQQRDEPVTKIRRIFREETQEGRFSLYSIATSFPGSFLLIPPVLYLFHVVFTCADHLVSDVGSTSSPLTWSTDEVVEYFKKSDISKYAELFRQHVCNVPCYFIAINGPFSLSVLRFL